MPFCFKKLKHNCRCQMTYLPAVYGWFTGAWMRVSEKCVYSLHLFFNTCIVFVLVPNLLRLFGMVIEQTVGAPPSFSKLVKSQKGNQFEDAEVKTLLCLLTALYLLPSECFYLPFNQQELLPSFAEEMCWSAAKKTETERLLPLSTLAECWHIVQRASQRIPSEKLNIEMQ